MIEFMLSNTEQNHLKELGITRYVLRGGEKETIPTTVSTSLVEDPWDKLKSAVSNCTKCQLSVGRTNTVFGVGSQNADLLIVGEAPGFYEDKQGEPFVGRAGALLDCMLKSIDLSREMVYIANVIKCRPENNRDPLPIEIETCTPYLIEQIKLIKPKLILALGRYAAHFLLKKTASLANLRGVLHTIPNISLPLYVTYHPAYLLRNPKDKQYSFQDLLKVRAYLASEQ
jgi:uracil-DNA glycosylase family 4